MRTDRWPGALVKIWLLLGGTVFLFAGRAASAFYVLALICALLVMFMPFFGKAETPAKEDDAQEPDASKDTHSAFDENPDFKVHIEYDPTWSEKHSKGKLVYYNVSVTRLVDNRTFPAQVYGSTKGESLQRAREKAEELMTAHHPLTGVPDSVTVEVVKKTPDEKVRWEQ